MIEQMNKTLAYYLVKNTWSRANDFYLGINTDDNVETQEGFSQHLWPCAKQVEYSKYNDSMTYQAADYFNIYRMLQVLSPSRDDIFYDIGCGKGRVICVLGRYMLTRVIGIDLKELLCKVARCNVERLRACKTQIEVRCEDAARADLSDGTIYFMYNPFGEATMREVLRNIERSLICSRRRVRIVYYNDVLKELFSKLKWCHQYKEFKTLTGRRIIFYANQHY